MIITLTLNVSRNVRDSKATVVRPATPPKPEKSLPTTDAFIDGHKAISRMSLRDDEMLVAALAYGRAEGWSLKDSARFASWLAYRIEPSKQEA